MMRFKHTATGLIHWVFLLSASFNVFAAEFPPHLLPCLEQPQMQAARSQELKEMVEADQKAREDWENLSDEEKIQMAEQDLVRRKRVGEILGEGCFKTADDYGAASLIYQHGDNPDHYYQAFVWANRAVQLGEEGAKGLVALTIDRYLVSIGKKQLFASQAYASEATGNCYCLQQVEASFPDAFRKEFSGISLAERFEWLVSINEANNCPNSECPIPLEPTPKGSLPGFW
jgi:hypothetical protein